MSFVDSRRACRYEGGDMISIHSVFEVAYWSVTLSAISLLGRNLHTVSFEETQLI